MHITLNGTTYTSPEALCEIDDEDIKQFLVEWFDLRDHVTGHTSGSTGTPKEIRLSKQDMIASARITNAYFGIGPASRLLLCLSPAYIAGKMMIVRSIVSGANLITAPVSSSPLRDIEQPVDFTALVPLQVETSLADPVTASRLSSTRQIIIGGAPVSAELEARLLHLPARCYATYGMTETVSHVALRDINGPRKSHQYFALGQVHFETDARGCLVIHAPHLQQQTFVTNDIVELQDPTHFEWLGRHDNVINSGGIKLFPEKIETLLAPYIKERFFITSEPDTRLGQRAVLVIESTPWPTEEVEKLTTRLKQTLSPHEVPKITRFIEHFTETYSGKIIRKLL